MEKQGTLLPTKCPGEWGKSFPLPPCQALCMKGDLIIVVLWQWESDHW
ncbi:Uncharacterised protein [Chlamydia trachomatis]|nr:Uncharacterised protein [Chlamydia trachomatis]